MDLAELEEDCESVSAGNPHIGSSLDDFLKTAEVMDCLSDYEIAKDREDAAHELYKTYTRRRQAAFQAYLKAYDALSDTITEETKRAIESRLDELQRKSNANHS